MIIGIDGNTLSIPHHCGIRRYSESLLRALFSIDKKHTYIVYSTHPVQLPKQPNIIQRTTAHLGPIGRRQVGIALLAQQDAVDVFHYLEPYGSLFLSVPHIVTTVHDTRWRDVFPAKDWWNRMHCEMIRAGIFQKTDVFISISKEIAKEMKSFMDDTQETKVIYEGVGEEFFRKKQKKQYMMVFADDSPRDNIDRIFDVFQQSSLLKKKAILLCIATTPSVKASLLKKAKQKRLDRFINVVYNVPTKTLVALYQKSYCLLYPSLYEGFGLPIIEAMACGTPVITSSKGAMKEIGGDAVLFVNPYQRDHMIKTLEYFFTNLSLQKKLQEKGLQRSKIFTWQKTAQETIRVYESFF